MPRTAPAETLAGATRERVSDSLRPIKAENFGFEQARHLLWRAGFGGSAAQIESLVALGPEKAVEHLVDYESLPAEPVTGEEFERGLTRPLSEAERDALRRARRRGDEETIARLRLRIQEGQRNDRRQIRRVQQWWLRRMIETERPLEEKMTLFWHGHFATSYRATEDSYHMFMQNQLFRAHATGSFAALLHAVIRDPAMLRYLDNHRSRRDRPNENLARELMELFSLGEGNYTERDIREGARALTGYTFRDDGFVFRQDWHDNGVKNILGRRGRLDGDGFVEAILSHRACPRFMAGKLYRHFALRVPTGRAQVDRAAERVIGALGATLARSRYRVKPVLRQLFLSEHFYDPAVMNERIKSPVELVVGASRSLGLPARSPGVLIEAMGLMGQNLFFPPSVAGWEGGRSWINTSTVFVRQNTLCFQLTGRRPGDQRRLGGALDTGDLLRSLERIGGGGGGHGAGTAVERLARLALGRADAATVGELERFVEQHGGRLDQRTLTGVLLLLTAMPGYQLC